MIKRFVTGLLLFIAIPVLTYAQYGKISGKVVDRETKEPLVGATIVLQGTALGASTDIDGRYVILNVPAGTYSVKASYVGYHPLTIEGVSVLAGLTRDLNIELSSTAVQVSGVEIIAQKPLIEKTATNAVRIQGSADIERLPVRGVQAYFTLQPGVVLQNGAVYIRGSRSDEVGYQVEGADVRNILGNGSLITTIPEALQEVSVQAGGYGADKGGANAGIVQQTFKTGGSKLNFMVQGETDNFGNYPGKQTLGTYSYGYSDYVFSVGGPLMTDNVKFFLAGENNFVRDANPWFWSGANFGYLKDNGTSGGIKGDSALVSWPAGNVPGRMNNRYSGNGTLLLDYKPVQVRLAGAFTWARNVNNNLLLNMFDLVRNPVTDFNNALLDGKVSYFLTANTFFELNLNYLDTRDKTYDPLVGDNVLGYNDSLVLAQHGITYVNRTQAPLPYNFYGFVFNRAGAPLTGFGKNHNSYIGGAVDLTSQIGNHEIKVGGSYQYWSISHYNIGAGVFSSIYTSPDIARDPVALATLLRRIPVNNYGFNEFGAPISSGPDGPKHPYFAAAYVQDRIEFSDLVVNAGLRFDYIFMDDWKFNDPSNPNYDPNNFLIYPSKGNTYAFVEPRLGFSFPVTDRTVFHLQYGKFVQAPNLSTVYRSRAAAAQIFAGQYYFSNPIGYNIQPVRTTQYEIGFSQQVSDFAAFDITGFYKDVKGQLQDKYFQTSANSVAPSYKAYANGDFETVMGMELSLRIRRVNRIQAEVNYTLQDARGTNSFANSAAALIEVTGGGITPDMVVPLTYDQTHRGSISLDYRWAKDDGGPILQQLGINLLLTFNSGHPFTLSTGSAGQQGPDLGALLNDADARTRMPVEPVNASTTPWFYQLDLRVDKTFNIGGLGLNVYVYAQNLLNTKNVINVYYRTGNAYDDGWLSDPTASGKTVDTYGPTYVQLYQVMNLQNNQNQLRLNGFVNFSTPRQIRVGARLEF